MTNTDALTHFLEGQFQAWNRQDAEPMHAGKGPVIAITRAPGCGGERLAQTLARELGLALYDGVLVEEIARDANVSEQVIATLDERIRSELDAWLDGLGGAPDYSSNQYMKCLRSILFAIAVHGNAVIVGRGANFLLPAGKKTIGLYLFAPLESRVTNVMQEQLLSADEARKLIVRIVCERRQWVKDMCFADVDDLLHYHLAINTALVSSENIVQIVKDIVRTGQVREPLPNAP